MSKFKTSSKLANLMLICVLTACTGGSTVGKAGSDNKDAKSAEPPAAPAVQKSEPVELVMYFPSSTGAQNSNNDTYGNPIAKKFPHIKPKSIGGGPGSTIPELLASGTEFDIMVVSTAGIMGSLIQYDLQYDITPLIQKHKYDLNQLEPTLVETMKQIGNGAIYGLPVSDNAMRLYYNKELFDKFGVPYPKDVMTWDEVYDLAVKMTRSDNGVQYRGLTMNANHYLPLNQFSAGFVDPKTNKSLFTTDPNWTKIINNFARFYQIPGNEVDAKTVDGGAQQNFFIKDRTAAMLVAYSQGVGTDYNWDMVQLPYFKELPGVGSQNVSGYWFINKMSKHKDEAFQAIAYLTSQEHQIFMTQNQYGSKTVLRDKMVQQHLGDAPFLKGKNIKALFPEKYAKPSVMTKYDSIASTHLRNAAYEVFRGVKDVNTALAEAAEKADKAIDAEKAK